jgi:hypothetical protein
MLQSCSDAFDDIAPYNTDTDIVSQTDGEESLTWEERLEKIMNTPPNIMINSGIALLGYEIISDNIDNAVDENFYKEEIKADENMIPSYSDDLKSLTAITKSEATLKSSPHQTFNFEEGDKLVDNLNLKGAKILKLKWNNNGVETNTVCAVSDKDGIIYDNFISNCFERETEESVVVSQNETTDNLAKTPRLKGGSETVSSDGTILTWTYTDKLTPLSGGTSGPSVTIKHIGYYKNGNLYNHTCSATPSNSPGKAAAEARTTTNQTIVFGYGLAESSSVSITITKTASSYNVTFTSSSSASGRKLSNIDAHTLR